jgi:hypothetical protein
MIAFCFAGQTQSSVPLREQPSPAQSEAIIPTRQHEQHEPSQSNVFGARSSSPFFFPFFLLFFLLDSLSEPPTITMVSSSSSRALSKDASVLTGVAVVSAGVVGKSSGSIATGWMLLWVLGVAVAPEARVPVDWLAGSCRVGMPVSGDCSVLASGTGSAAGAGDRRSVS